MADKSWKAFERTIAARLGEWWDGDKKHFRRLYLKAGWPWADGKGPDVVRIIDPSTKEPSPDFVDFDFPFWVECKKRKTFNFYDFLSQKPGDSAATAWYRETLIRAWAARRTPFVFVRYPGSPRILLITTAEVLDSVRVRYMRVTVPYKHSDILLCGEIYKGKHHAGIVDFNAFVERADPVVMEATDWEAYG